MAPPPPPEAGVIEATAYREGASRVSLGRAFRSVSVPRGGSPWKRFGAFFGPGTLVAVGYMDPGNWATDIAGGSRFGYQLLSVVLLSSLMAMLLQALSAKLGIGAGRDLAHACGERYRGPTRIALWLLCEVAIIACDLAEVIGTAVALQLLFGIPLVWGVCLTGLNVFVALALERRGFRKLEAAIGGLMCLTGLCLAAELLLSRPNVAGVARGLVPSAQIVADPAMLYLAIGIIGATVMPHNLYLHSAVVQTRRFRRDPAGKREAIRFATIDSMVALSFALLINAAILILAASAFHRSGQTGVTEIGDAYRLLSPTLGAGAASILFGVALLVSGQNSTVTGTIAGQIVMEGFTRFRMAPHIRRIVARLIAIVPAAIAVILYGDGGTTDLLIVSQVVLSLQLPFAVVPLVRLTGDRAVMGEFANGRWLAATAWAIAGLIILLNLILVAQLFR
ncbi:Nramp family divalent metal transporter [Sphingomonas sp.]|uniref:Nramp family divalent metal transporter n=1 Tax=Sphingomonas sp. TaxID=28214 RepID=UPI003B3BC7EB